MVIEVKENMQTIGLWSESEYVKWELFQTEDILNDTDENVLINPVLTNTSAFPNARNK